MTRMWRQRGMWRAVPVGLLIAALLTPLPLLGAASLGTARGVRGVELSLDGGRRWLDLGAQSLPILDGVQVRSTSGGALLDLTDGSRINVLPFTVLRVRDTGTGIEFSLVSGRVTFRLLAQTRVAILTPSVRLDPVRTQVMVGEVFVSGAGTMGLRMAQGSLQVQELSGEQRVMTASLEPVFFPKRPATAGPLFAVDAPAMAPAGSRSVFSPKGESLGYVRPDAQLVVHPGFTADLTQPFPVKFVQLAMAQVPEKDRRDATPLFDVNGGYLGYLAGPTFYAQAQIAQAQVAQAVTGAPTSGTVLGMSTGTFLAVAGGTLVVVGGGIVVGQCITDNSPCGDGGGAQTTTVATPLRPKR